MPANLETQQWPQDWKSSVFIPIPKKGNANNAQTTTQMHSSHTLVKKCLKFSKPDFNSMWTVNFQIFKLVLEKAEEPEIKLPTNNGSSEKARVPEKHLFLFYWLCQSLLGIPDHLTCLVRNLYAGQETTVRTGHGTKDWFQIGKGVHQGCILSPCLFNLHAEYLMRNAGLEEAQAGIRLPGEISITTDMRMTPPLWQKVKRN